MAKKITCSNPEALKASLKLIGTAEKKAGGQEKITLECGLITNVYDNGSVTFQGKVDECKEKKEKIINLIDVLNTNKDLNNE
jgi:hypothetical protein